MRSGSDKAMKKTKAEQGDRVNGGMVALYDK